MSANCSTEFTNALKDLSIDKKEERMNLIQEELTKIKNRASSESEYRNQVISLMEDIKFESKEGAYYKIDDAIKREINTARLDDPDFKGNYAEAVASHARNSSFNAKGIANNVENNIQNYTQMTLSHLNKLNDAPKKLKILADPKHREMQKQILKHLTSRDKSKHKLDPAARELADAVQAMLATQHDIMQKSGLIMGKIDDGYVPQTIGEWNAISKLGKEKYAELGVNSLDLERTGMTREQATKLYERIYDRMEESQGLGIIERKSVDEILRGELSGITRRKKRKFHYKDEGYANFWEQTTESPLLHTLIRDNDSKIHRAAIFEKYGAFPKQRFNDLRADATARAKDDFRLAKKEFEANPTDKALEKKLQEKQHMYKQMSDGWIPDDAKSPVTAMFDRLASKDNIVFKTVNNMFGSDLGASNPQLFSTTFREARGEKFDALWAVVSREVDEIVNPARAKIYRNYLSYRYSTTLGSMAIGNIPDLANQSMGLIRNSEIGFGQAFFDTVNTLATKAHKMDSSATKYMLASVEDWVSQMSHSAKLDGPIGNMATSLSQATGKLSGMNMLERHSRRAAAFSHGYVLKKNLIDTDGKGMDPLFKKALDRNELGDTRSIDLIRDNMVDLGDGVWIVDHASLHAQDPSVAMKYNRFLNYEIKHHSVEQSSFRQKAVSTQGLKQGTWGRIFRSQLWMYKSFMGKMAFNFDAIHHARVHDSLKQRIQATVGFVGLGYLAQSLYDIRDNRKPTSINDIAANPARAMDFVNRSGLAGIVGDVANTAKFARGPDDAIFSHLGLAASDMRTFATLVNNVSKRYAEGKRGNQLFKASDMNKLKGYIPFNNIPVIKAAWEYAASDAVYDWYDPKYLQNRNKFFQEKGIERLLD